MLILGTLLFILLYIAHSLYLIIQGVIETAPGMPEPEEEEEEEYGDDEDETKNENKSETVGERS